MSESVDILIQAEDRASSEFKKVEGNLEGMAKRAKETGERTKKSVEVVGSLANAFGGTAIGSFSSQLAGLTEKVSAFSEVAKTGTAGALAFKVSIAAAIGAVTYKVAETVASWAMGIDAAKARADAAAKSFAQMSAALGETRQKAFAQAKEDIGLIYDTGEREKAANARAAALEKQAAELGKKVQEAQASLAQKQATLNNSFFKGNAESDVKIAQEQLDNIQAIRDELAKEAQSLRDLNSDRTKSVEARKAENAAKDKSDSFIKGLQAEVEMLKATKDEQLKLEAARNAVPEQRGKAEALLAEREALKAKAEEQKKAEQAAEQEAKKEEDAQKRIAELEKKRLVDLEARRIELTKGKEAAAAYRLEQEGLSKASAERLAALEEEQRLREDDAGKAKNLEPDKAPQTALQSRLLTSGTGGDPILAAANKQNATLEKAVNKLDALLYEAQKQRGFTVKTAVIP